MADEDDYMSDKFLSHTVQAPKLVSREAQRKHKAEAKHKESCIKGKIKPQRVLQQECRDAGLEKALGAENKGFAMLQKMGYKPGMAIGKKGNEGLKVPIGIKVKADRGGLGEETERKRRQEEMNAMRASMLAKRKKLIQEHAEDYRAQQSAEHSNKQSERDLYSSQKACLHLDSQQGIKEPCEAFFWPESYLQKSKNTHDEEEEDYDGEELEDEEEECVEFTPAEKLEILTIYLRKQYHYCIWCGAGFDDKEDLKANCPGNTASAHD